MGRVKSSGQGQVDCGVNGGVFLCARADKTDSSIEHGFDVQIKPGFLQ